MQIVNGYACRNCTEVDLAHKRIDPAHPNYGPDGIDSPISVAKARHDRAVRFGGLLTGSDPGSPPARTEGQKVDLRV